jgi:fructoselysine-6-phosphate deglycase
MHWMRTKSIHSAEFFHGMLEIVDRDTAVTVFVGEDSQRSLSERVAKFLPRITGRYTVIDTKEYPLEGISTAYRGSVSHLVMHAVTNRIDAHLEQLNRHPMEIRRYYRQLKY